MQYLSAARTQSRQHCRAPLSAQRSGAQFCLPSVSTNSFERTCSVWCVGCVCCGLGRGFAVCPGRGRSRLTPSSALHLHTFFRAHTNFRGSCALSFALLVTQDEHPCFLPPASLASAASWPGGDWRTAPRRPVQQRCNVSMFVVWAAPPASTKPMNPE